MNLFLVNLPQGELTLAWFCWKRSESVFDKVQGLKVLWRRCQCFSLTEHRVITWKTHIVCVDWPFGGGHFKSLLKMLLGFLETFTHLLG